jgi:hypothetical protein
MSDINSKSVNDLKCLIKKAGLSYADIDKKFKRDLCVRAKQAMTIVEENEEDEGEGGTDSGEEGFEVPDDEIDDDADANYGEAAEATAAAATAQARVDLRNGRLKVPARELSSDEDDDEESSEDDDEESSDEDYDEGESLQSLSDEESIVSASEDELDRADAKLAAIDAAKREAKRMKLE